MIFDRLWWAERRDRKKEGKLKAIYQPKLEAAKKAGDHASYEEILSEWHFESQGDDRYETLKTDLLVKRARRLGIPVPFKPSWDDPENNNWDYWDMNQNTGSYTLKAKAELDLRREIRKEELERLQYAMRWVSQVVIPLIGLIGSVMGLLALIHALK